MQTHEGNPHDLRRLASPENICGKETPPVVLFFVVVRNCIAFKTTDAMNPSRNLSRSSFSFVFVVPMTKMNMNKLLPKQFGEDHSLNLSR
jgi:hypothetical protein